MPCPRRAATYGRRRTSARLSRAPLFWAMHLGVVRVSAFYLVLSSGAGKKRAPPDAAPSPSRPSPPPSVPRVRPSASPPPARRAAPSASLPPTPLRCAPLRGRHGGWGGLRRGRTALLFGRWRGRFGLRPARAFSPRPFRVTSFYRPFGRAASLPRATRSLFFFRGRTPLAALACSAPVLSLRLGLVIHRSTSYSCRGGRAWSVFSESKRHGIVLLFHCTRLLSL